MDKRSFYGLHTLEQELEAFEERYCVSSVDFFADYLAGRVPDSVDRFDQVVWADTYKELCRLSGSPTDPSAEPRSPKALQPAG